MTLFTGFFGYNVVMPILDNFFLEGWPAIYRVSLILMRKLQANILKCSSRERISILIKSMTKQSVDL